MWGANDREVPPALSRERIAAALQGHGADDKVLIIFPDATHSLYIDQDDAWDWQRTAPGFQETITEWLDRRR
jgi:pimeloyl-ACP methyl ester carboxylesterase